MAFDETGFSDKGQEKGIHLDDMYPWQLTSLLFKCRLLAMVQDKTELFEQIQEVENTIRAKYPNQKT